MCTYVLTACAHRPVVCVFGISCSPPRIATVHRHIASQVGAISFASAASSPLCHRLIDDAIAAVHRTAAEGGLRATEGGRTFLLPPLHAPSAAATASPGHRSAAGGGGGGSGAGPLLLGLGALGGLAWPDQVLYPRHFSGKQVQWLATSTTRTLLYY